MDISPNTVYDLNYKRFIQDSNTYEEVKRNWNKDKAVNRNVVSAPFTRRKCSLNSTIPMMKPINNSKHNKNLKLEILKANEISTKLSPKNY